MPLVRPVIRPSPARTLAALATCVACLVVPVVGRAEDTPDSAPPAGAKAQAPSAVVSLINRLAQRGLLTKQDEADLVSMADADAADARVEAAEARLAAARAEAAAARARVQLSTASKELAQARANAAQLSANQAAAVRLLLGQGQSGAAAAPAPEAEESVAAAPAASYPRSRAPAAADESAGAATSASVAAAEEAQPASSTPVAPAAPPEATGVNLARNDDGAVVVAEVPQEGKAPLQEAAPESAESEQPAPEAPAARAAPGRAGLARNDEGAVVVPEDGPSEKASTASTPDDSAEASSPAAKEVAASPGAESPKLEDSGGEADQVASAPSAEAPGSPESASASPASGEETAPAAQAAEASQDSGPPRTAAEAPVVGTEEAPAAEPPAEARPPSRAAPRTRAPTPTAAEASAPSDDVVRVAYVPEYIKREIREEVKNEVITEARKENWGAPSSGPEWVSKFTLYGDIRVRSEEVVNHAGNNNTGAFPNFNAINTGAPFDTSGNVFSPQYNVDQNRNRERLRARLGAAVAVSGGFTAGLRIATGNDNQPVSENQTFGAAGNAQGGDFAKYALWLDRAYIKYQSEDDLGTAFWMEFGRFDNPFFSTSLIWANEIGFDGLVASIPLKAHLSGRPNEDFKPYLVAGAFPVFDTDLNYATNQPAKFKSYDKWLFAGQLGFDAKLPGDYQLKAAAALYDFKNIQGQLSSPFTPLTTSDAGDTDASRPSWAQNGNTYMALRDIVPGPLNNNGTIDQFQYYGLATPFKELAVTEGLYYNHFEPFQISLVSEWVKNLAFDRARVAANAVNNGGTSAFIGGNTGWMATLKFGDAIIKDLGDWNASVGYRRVESDAVVDGFNDADFGGILFGTNLKGFTLTADVGLATGVWVEAKWMSASAIAGPTFKNDLLQLDLNTKF